MNPENQPSQPVEPVTPQESLLIMYPNLAASARQAGLGDLTEANIVRGVELDRHRQRNELYRRWKNGLDFTTELLAEIRVLKKQIVIDWTYHDPKGTPDRIQLLDAHERVCDLHFAIDKIDHDGDPWTQLGVLLEFLPPDPALFDDSETEDSSRKSASCATGAVNPLSISLQPSGVTESAHTKGDQPAR